ncbi:LPS export ABC transporter periplasmic protein LptC [Pelagibacterales bacterium SAG-MED31]|nr:LPS export ABC transporter periplasmic protein LptC [Pelagibacterales bacterium SAG-MED31]
MNFLLKINKSKLFIFIIFLIILIFIFFTFNFINNGKPILKVVDITANKSDIVRPKFSISGKKSQIFITAKNGNFISEEKILLENNVKFKSKEFQLESDNVIFDRKNLIATSENKSKFLSKNTSIISAGFDITENGNIINFKGQTILIFK